MSATLLLLAVVHGAGPASAGTPTQASGSVDGLLENTPHFCVAEWSGPTSSCAWAEPVRVTGVGRNRNNAERAAAQRLRQALAAVTRAAVLEAEDNGVTRLDDGLKACARVGSRDAITTCFAQPALARDGICYADLPDDPCWSEHLFTVEGIGWQAGEEARAATCDQVYQQARSRGDSEIDQLSCRARCLTSVRVRCN